MESSRFIRGAGSKFTRVLLLTAALAFAAGTSHADQWGRGSGGDGGNGHHRDGGRGRTYKPRGDHRDRGNQGRDHKSGDSWNHGGSRDRGGNGGWSGGSGGRSQNRGGNGGWSGGGGRSHGSGSGSWSGGGSGSWSGGGHSYGGTTRYRGTRSHTYVYGGPTYRGYRTSRPRTVVRFGIGLNSGPAYCPPSYGYGYGGPAPVYVEPGYATNGYGYAAPPPPPPPVATERVYEDEAPYTSDDSGEIDVENDPPAGCYYYDTSCRQRFSNLDDYTAHLDTHHHSQTISVVRSDGNQTIRVLEFVDGYWQVQQ